MSNGLVNFLCLISGAAALLFVETESSPALGLCIYSGLIAICEMIEGKRES